MSFTVCLLCSVNSYAKNLGTWGSVYPITEEDFTKFIHERLLALKNSGKLREIQNNFVRRVKAHTLRPMPVAGLTTTDNPKTVYYDPTFILQHDIKDATGKTLFPAGTTVNPLKKVKLHEALFFLDADDTRQIKWALKNEKHYNFVKYILVNGDIKDATKALHNRVYFDQYGKLTGKLGITHIPCIVTQKGLKLQIKEYSLDRLTKR